MNWNVQTVTTTKMEVTKVRTKPKTIDTADLKHIPYTSGPQPFLEATPF